MIILGIGGILGEAACGVLKDGRLVAAVEERKVSRRHSPGDLPEQAIALCLKLAKVEPGSVDSVAIARPLAAAPGARLHLEVRVRVSNSRVRLVGHPTVDDTTG